MSKDIILRVIDKSGNGIFEPVDLDAGGVQANITYETQNPKWGELATVSRVEQLVTIPATPKNKRLLNYFHLPISFFGAPYIFDLTVRGAQLLTGTAIIQDAAMIGSPNGTIPQDYKLQLLGDNYDWGYSIRDLYLKDLDFWDLATTITAPNVSAGIQAQYPAQKSGFCLIKYKAWGNISRFGVDCPDLAEFTPFLYAKHILDKIFSQINKILVSDFFDTDEFARYILPLPMQDKYTAEFAGDLTRVSAFSNVFTPPNTFIDYNFILSNPPFAPAPPMVGTTYTAGFSGFCRVVSRTTHVQNNIAPSAIACLEIWVNGALKFKEAKLGFLSIELNYTSPVFDVLAGDTIQLKNSQFYAFSSPPNTDITSADVTIEIDAKVGYDIYNVPVYHKYLLGDWKVKDFILGLTQMFNLTWSADRFGNVFCEPANEYTAIDAPTNTSTPQSGFYNNVDLGATQKHEDMQSVGNVESLEAEFDMFKYAFKADANEDYTKPDKNNQSIVFGAANVAGVGDSAINIDERTNSFFSNCFHTFDLGASALDPAGSGSKDNCQVPLLYAVANSSNKRSFEPRLMCFYASGVNPYGTMRYTQNHVNTIFTANYPFAFMVNYRDTTGLSPVLSYGDVQINFSTRLGLFSRFFAKNLQIALNSKAINSFFYLSLSFVRDFDFRTLIYYKGMYCRCLKVEGFDINLDNTPTKLTLVPQILDPEYTLTNSPIVGLV